MDKAPKKGSSILPIMFGLGITLVTGSLYSLYSYDRGKEDSIAKTHEEIVGEMSRCSTGQQLTLRDTTGQATFTVTYRDGAAISYECTEGKNSLIE